MEEEPVITWYRTDNLILGFCGRSGIQGVYRFWLGESDKWQFCPPETKAWDFYHQKVFLHGKVEDCQFSDIEDDVPPLPAQIPPPARYHVTDPSDRSVLEALPGRGLVGRIRRVLPGSRLFKKVCAAPEGRLPVYVVLHEDRYESVLGDGIFRDFESAHLEEDAAKAHMEQYYEPDERADDPTTLGEELYIRKVYLTVSGWTLALDTRDSQLSPFDHFMKKQIVRDLEHPERRLDPWGKPYPGAGTGNEIGTKCHE